LNKFKVFEKRKKY